MKKYIFSNINTKDNFVCFEGCDFGFWENDERIKYGYTDLNYNQAKIFEKAGIVLCTEIDTNEEERNMYVNNAEQYAAHIEMALNI